MVELNNERIDEILHKETVKTEEQATILRAIYTRYMRLYEEYFADVDTLDDAKIAELRTYHLETRNLVKAYYGDRHVSPGIRQGIHRKAARAGLEEICFRKLSGIQLRT